MSSSSLDTRKYPFLQTRINRDETPDMFGADIQGGIADFWTRFQKPFATSRETVHLDEQVVRGAVEELLGFNGWAAAACSSLRRPFAQVHEDDYGDLGKPGQLYYFAMVVHGADHFLIDQLAVIVQLSKKLGPQSIFVSLIDYASLDSTPFICDIAEAVMILLGISFRIRQVPPMTADPAASYYPLEEAYTRNLAMEPLLELWDRRRVQFSQVIWLKGFTCPNDILETMRVSQVNEAAMVCSMDWKEHNGFFIYNDRWRTRDMDGNLFRGSKSTSPIDEAPPRDAYGGARYTLHLPFQVFCCESGAHIVDPHKSYYQGVTYQSSVSGVFNISAASDGKTPRWSEGPCMDSSQLHFCRDMWMVAFRDNLKEQAKRLANDEKAGKGRKTHPFMDDLVSAMQASYAPTLDPKIGYPNSGDYLADETGASPGGGPGMDNAASTLGFEDNAEQEGGEGDDEDVPEEGYEEQKADEAIGESAVVEEVVIPKVPGADGEEDEAGGAEQGPAGAVHKRSLGQAKHAKPKANAVGVDADAHPELEKRRPRSLPNHEFPDAVARILVNPRCVTTYAGVSHTQLALDLFGSGEDEKQVSKAMHDHEGERYTLDEWRTPPESFVCQEMRTTGGRTAAKQQRRTGFQQARLLLNGWRPT